MRHLLLMGAIVLAALGGMCLAVGYDRGQFGSWVGAVLNLGWALFWGSRAIRNG